MTLLVFPAYMMQDLSNQLPSILKSHISSLVLEATNTSNLDLNCKIEDFLTLKIRSFSFVLSPLKACHLLCAVIS